MTTEELKWEVKKRLEEIESCLWWKGKLGRTDLMSKFGISPQQASADISLYQKLAPGSAEFNRSARQYEPSISFEPKFIKIDSADYVEWRSEAGEGVTIIPMPLRNAPLPTLRTITLAIHQGKSLQIEYQSMSTAELVFRCITPHTIVFDGYRYHVRAYCHSRHEFRDFVMGRITKAEDLGDAGLGKDKDAAWNTLIILRIGTHPKLSDSQRKIIERDYGMVKGELQLRVRQAMLHYIIIQLRLDRFTEERTPAEQQIILLNPEVLLYKA